MVIYKLKAKLYIRKGIDAVAEEYGHNFAGGRGGSGSKVTSLAREPSISEFCERKKRGEPKF